MRRSGVPQSNPTLCSSRKRTTPPAAATPNMPPPVKKIAWMRSTGLTGWRRTPIDSAGAELL